MQLTNSMCHDIYIPIRPGVMTRPEAVEADLDLMTKRASEAGGSPSAS